MSKNIFERIEYINKPILVACNGTFDLLHRSHIELFEYAKSLGDYLIVGLNSDSSVKKNKGPNRPINNQEDRYKVLSSIKWIDKIIIFYDDSAIEFLNYYQPEIIVKGSDYDIDKINPKERETVEKYGGKFIFKQSKPEKYSSTLLINKIKGLR